MDAMRPVLAETRLVAHLLAQQQRPLSQPTRERLAQAMLDWFTAGWSAIEMPAAARLRRLADGLFSGPGDAAVGHRCDRPRHSPVAVRAS